MKSLMTRAACLLALLAAPCVAVAEPLGGQFSGTTLDGRERVLSPEAPDAPTLGADPTLRHDALTVDADDPNDRDTDRSPTLAALMFALMIGSIVAGTIIMHRFNHTETMEPM